ncbi:hypothetical protein ACFVZW_08320 [Streptomyces sp. NPDC059567]|uniref:hypothetical protein n=1 Tax=Streptomyces sp. NPDC059567 TaxID=3346867 RepID=UPI003698ABA5
MLNRVPFDEALRSTVGTPKQAELLDSSPRSRVWRVRLADRRLVIVKPGDLADAVALAGRAGARLTAALRIGLVGSPARQSRSPQNPTCVDDASRSMVL